MLKIFHAGLVLLFGIGSTAQAVSVEALREAATHPMTFVEIPSVCQPPMLCQRAVLAKGTILYDTASQLHAYLVGHRAQPPEVVVLNSGGGSFGGSLALGLMVRKHGLDTLVPQNVMCASGCVYAFMGGIRRTVLPGGALAVHVNQVDPTHLVDHGTAGSDTALEANQEIAFQIKFLAAMGIRPAMLNVIFRSFGEPLLVPPDCARYLRLTNTQAETDTVACGSAEAIPMHFGLREDGLDMGEADRLLNPGTVFLPSGESISDP